MELATTEFVDLLRTNDRSEPRRGPSGIISIGQDWPFPELTVSPRPALAEEDVRFRDNELRISINDEGRRWGILSLIRRLMAWGVTLDHEESINGRRWH
jgi:hypothetical protein